MEPKSIQLERIYATLGIQFPGIDIGKLIPEIDVTLSRKTGRIRAIFDGSSNDRLFSLRTSDGRFLPTFEGGRRLLECGLEDNRITMNDDAAPFIASGKSAFCKHVIAVDDNVVPEGEVLLIDSNQDLLAIGTAQQPGYIIRLLSSGVAAKVKHSRD